MRFSLFLVVNFAFALDWRIKKAAFNDRNEKYEAIMAKIESADTFDEIQVNIRFKPTKLTTIPFRIFSNP